MQSNLLDNIQVKDAYKFLSVIMDLYSGKILSWSLTDTRTTEDIAKILKRALHKRQPNKSMIFHTDRGIQFTGKGFRTVLLKRDFKPGVNR